jgi:hypothetical protein
LIALYPQEQEFKAMLLNFKEICRLCLQSGNKLHPIFDTTDKLEEKIKTIAPTLNVSMYAW